MFRKSLTIFLEGGRLIFASLFPCFCYFTSPHFSLLYCCHYFLVSEVQEFGSSDSTFDAPKTPRKGRQKNIRLNSRTPELLNYKRKHSFRNVKNYCYKTRAGQCLFGNTVLPLLDD